MFSVKFRFYLLNESICQYATDHFCKMSLFSVYQPGTSIASLCKDPAGASTTHQPQLMCIGDLKSPTRQYIIVAKNDNISIPLDDGLTCGVDKLFKLYWVCNLAYPAPLGSVFTFFEYIYDIPFSTQRRTKVVELISQLKASK